MCLKPWISSGKHDLPHQKAIFRRNLGKVSEGFPTVFPFIWDFQTATFGDRKESGKPGPFPACGLMYGLASPQIRGWKAAGM